MLLLAALALATLALAARADAFVYWTNLQTGAIGRANLDGDPNSVNNNFIPGVNAQAVGVAVDANYIYWANIATPAPPPEQGPPGAIGRASLDGTGVEPNFIPSVNAGGVAVDDQYIYWADSDTGAIGRANLPNAPDGDPTNITQSFIGGDVGA